MNLVKKFGLKRANVKHTTAPTHVKLFKDSGGTLVDEKLYRSVISSLLYLTASKPDIAFVVGMCAKYQSNLRNSHLLSAKRIIKHISG